MVSEAEKLRDSIVVGAVLESLFLEMVAKLADVRCDDVKEQETSKNEREDEELYMFVPV